MWVAVVWALLGVAVGCGARERWPGLGSQQQRPLGRVWTARGHACGSWSRRASARALLRGRTGASGRASTAGAQQHRVAPGNAAFKAEARRRSRRSEDGGAFLPTRTSPWRCAARCSGCRCSGCRCPGSARAMGGRAAATGSSTDATQSAARDGSDVFPVSVLVVGGPRYQWCRGECRKKGCRSAPSMQCLLHLLTFTLLLWLHAHASTMAASARAEAVTPTVAVRALRGVGAAAPCAARSPELARRQQRPQRLLPARHGKRVSG